MFAIIVSEKGGAERRETFDKSEINVGRVQGNDLTLPKGNVSKHHARLLFRDGRFIVTDLKSTNGTYVNGRKIAQATIVREGDKIYIGDFVLRLEANAAAGAVAEAPAPAPDVQTAEGESEETQGRDQPPAGRGAPPMVTLKAPTTPPGAPQPRPQPVNVSHAGPPAPPAASGAAAPPGPPPLAPGAENVPADKPRQPSMPPPGPAPLPLGGVSRSATLPLNQMSPSPLMGARPMTAPSAGQAAAQPAPAPAIAPIMTPPQPIPTPQFPPLPGAAGAPAPQAAAVQPLPLPSAMGSPRAQRAPAPQPAAPAAPAPATAPVPTPAFPLPGTASQPVVAVQPAAAPAPAAPPAAPVVVATPNVPQPAAISPVSRGSAPPPRIPPKQTAAQAGRRLALTTLLDHIAEAVDLAPLRATPIATDALATQLERAAQAGAATMRQDGDAPEGVDLDSIVREAVRELVGLGPFGPLLDDDDVTEIHCVRFDQIVTRRVGAGVVSEPTTFSSEDALYRAIARLAQQSGEAWKPGESVLERRLSRGVLVAIAPPSAPHHVATIRKQRHVESSLDAFTSAGALSKAMAQFLEACVSARANVLVAGTSPLPLVAALAEAATSSDRIVVVHDVEDVGVGSSHVVRLAVPDARKGGEDVVRAAAKLQPDRLVLTQLVGGVAAGAVDAMMEGTRGVLAALPSQSLRQGVARLVAQVGLYRSAPLEGMREVVSEAFDIAVEVAAFPDGRFRVTRIAELAGSDAKGVVVRDLFVFNAESAGAEGTFGPTGIVPRIAADLAAQGTKLDPALFKRPMR